METGITHWLKLRRAEFRTIRNFVLCLKNDPLDSGIPWIVTPAIEWLNSFLKPSMEVFEWGSGGSTVYISQRVHHLTSIEYDDIWFRSVTVNLWLRRIRNCQLLLIPPKGDTHPGPYRSTSHKFPAHSFEQYCKSIEAYPDASLDLIVIDGRARSACITHARTKVKVGGYLLLDDSGRPSYQSAIEQLTNFQRTDFAGPVPFLKSLEHTSIFQRLT